MNPLLHSHRPARRDIRATAPHPTGIVLAVLLAAGAANPVDGAGTGAHAARPDRIEYFGGDGRFHWFERPAALEFESLLTHLKASAGEPVRQDMAAFGPGWGGDAQVFWRPPPPVDTPIRNWPHLRVTVPVPRPGRYRLTLVHTVAPDYARVRIFLDGKPVTDIDGYATAVAAQRVELGEHRLDGDSLELLFTVFGKYSGSGGYCVGLDRLELQAVAATDADSPR